MKLPIKATTKGTGTFVVVLLARMTQVTIRLTYRPLLRRGTAQALLWRHRRTLKVAVVRALFVWVPSLGRES